MIKKQHKLDISHVVAEHLCNSCGACFAICNNGSISFSETTGGYVSPRINSDTCIHCGLCYDVCQGSHFGKTLTEQIPEDPFVGHILSCYVGRATDEAVFSNGQSGGVTTAFLVHLFETGQIEAAVVAVMTTANPPRGDVLLVRSAAELLVSQKSKYTPIPLLKAVSEIKKIPGGIALVGLPCHIHGLYNLMDLTPTLARKRLFKLGLVCDRVMTTAAIDFIGKKASRGAIRHLVFRDKMRPSYPGNLVVEKADGQEVVLRASLRMTLKDFFTPVRCRLCFDKLNVFADVVFGDPHGLRGVDRLHGETVVFARNETGQQLIDGASRNGVVALRESDTEVAIDGQGINKKRSEWVRFMRAWGEMGKTIPDYPLSLHGTPPAARHKKWLNHAMALDGCSREELLTAADRWLFNQKIKKFVFWPLRKSIAIINRIKP